MRSPQPELVDSIVSDFKRRKMAVWCDGNVDTLIVEDRWPTLLDHGLGQLFNSSACYDNPCHGTKPGTTDSWNYSIWHYCASSLCIFFLSVMPVLRTSHVGIMVSSRVSLSPASLRDISKCTADRKTRVAHFDVSTEQR